MSGEAAVLFLLARRAATASSDGVAEVPPERRRRLRGAATETRPSRDALEKNDICPLLPLGRRVFFAHAVWRLVISVPALLSAPKKNFRCAIVLQATIRAQDRLPSRRLALAGAAVGQPTLKSITLIEIINFHYCVERHTLPRSCLARKLDK